MKLSLAGLLVLVGCTTAPATRPLSEPSEPVVASVPAGAAEAAPLSPHVDNPMLERALSLYAAHDYRAAAEAFEAAYAFERSPSLLLARAQALRLAGDCPAALPLFERFLDEQSDPTYTNAVRPMLDACLDGPDPAIATR